MSEVSPISVTKRAAADLGEGAPTIVDVVCGACKAEFSGSMPLHPRYRKVVCPHCGAVNAVNDIR